jgi:uncharacterized membrane protein
MASKALAFIAIFTIVVSAVGLLLYAYNGGFGGRRPGFSGREVPRSLWLVLFIVPLLVAVSVSAYSLVFPSLSRAKTSTVPTEEEGGPALNSVLRVLKDDERRVVETLVSEGGTMLQKDIRWKTGFSRVKTHRILLRLIKRGVVSAEKYFNTNKITLADWLVKKKG